MAPDTRLERAVQGARGSGVLRHGARLGLVARGCFYLLLAYLAAAVAAGWGTDRQANANGALTTVAETPFGLAALVGAVLGFLAFGLARLAGAAGDHSVGRLRRLTTAGQGLFYLAMAATTLRFVLGRGGTGSTQQQRSTTAALLLNPVGRLVLLAVGLVVVGICAWQVRLALRGGYADSLRTQEMGRRTRRAARIIGPVGVVARALALAPVGVLLVVAALTDQAGRAKDLDQLLVALDQSSTGRLVVWLVASGFFCFALYSFIEVPYRTTHAGD
ncbi:MAG: hypothetical protein QOI54_2416 [Actinomycetota bacterium]|nr:hypothetical protein [Actinomycetota bacterium]